MMHAAAAQMADYLDQMYFSIPFMVFMSGILLLERFKPAAPAQPLLARGLRFDLAIGIFAFMVNFFVLAAVMSFLFGLYERFLPPPGNPGGGSPLGWPLSWPLSWPNWLKIVVVFVANDFALWLSHVARHRVPWLWRFHAFHHSQRELNVFTEFRVHPVDQVANTILISLLFYLCQIPYESALAWLLVQKYYLMFVHANVGISYGPLDRLFVSPRIHRVHHALDAQLHDRNFGVYLTLWDSIFRTWHRALPHAQRTGIAGIVDERGVPWQQLPSVYLRQIATPFWRSPAAA